MFDDPNLPTHLERILNACSDTPSSDFDLNTERPDARKLRAAAVMAPLILVNDEWHMILTKRPGTMKHHPGQIAFPGGKQDQSDDSLLDTALRETQEEVGIAPNQIQILGQLPAHETVTAFNITPFVASVDPSAKLQKELYEVEEVFTVPFRFLMAEENYQIQSRVWFGAERFYYAVPYGPYYIWGATARMLHALNTLWNSHED